MQKGQMFKASLWAGESPPQKIQQDEKKALLIRELSCSRQIPKTPVACPC